MQRPVEKAVGTTLPRQIRVALAQRILNGDLAPGARLKDQEVAAAFGTSNTPVREALRQLEKDGLVEVYPRRGCMVRRIDLHELGEVFDLRIILEAHAVRLAAGTLTADQLARLESLAHENEVALAAGDASRASDVGQAFHALLLEAAGNSLLAGFVGQLDNRIRLARRVYLNKVRLVDQPGYGAIVQALRAHDAEAAAAAMAGHIAYGRRCVLQALGARDPG